MMAPSLLSGAAARTWRLGRRLRPIERWCANVSSVPLKCGAAPTAGPLAEALRNPAREASPARGPQRLPGGVTPAFCAELLPWLRSEKISKDCALAIVEDATRTLAEQPTLVDLEVSSDCSITVVGDIHGKYRELLQVLETNGMPSAENMYIFNGDFVDRGPQSLECVLALFALKVCYPDAVHLARGNHEIRYVNMYYGFDDQVAKAYGNGMYDAIAEAFCQLPLAHVLNAEVLVVHGGLAHFDGVTLDDIRRVDRRREPPKEGLMTDLLWSDPSASSGRGENGRGFGIAFGADVTEHFLSENGLKLIIRSHQDKVSGYDVDHGGKVLTVFSAPDYCGRGNKGAYVRLDGATLTPSFSTFSAVPVEVHVPTPNPNYVPG